MTLLAHRNDENEQSDLPLQKSASHPRRKFGPEADVALRQVSGSPTNEIHGRKGTEGALREQ